MTDRDPATHKAIPSTLDSERFLLRPIVAQDAEPLAAILGEPGVRRWWTNFDLARVERELVHHDDDDETYYLIEIAGEVAGAIDCHEENEPDFRHAGIDLFLGERWQGQGYGPEAIRAVARMLIDVRGHHRLVIDPAADNVNAIAAYARVGFQPVGVMRNYTRSENGDWIDGLLMDLLAEELR